MTDPFQNVDAAGPEFIRVFANAMEVRQSEPAMETIVARYLDKLAFSEGSLTVEVGSGAGAIARRIADRAAPGAVIGFEPSKGFVEEARIRAEGVENLSFEVADGAALPLPDDAADAVVMHTVLSHVDKPDTLIGEACRVLRSGGRLVICDADFSKSTLSSFANDPLDICAREFTSHFVTDAYLVGKLRQLIADAGLILEDFTHETRVSSTREGMRPWVDRVTSLMVERGDIGQPLADAFVAEFERRADNGTLYGYQVFATAIALKP